MAVQAVRRTVAALITLVALALLVPPFINASRYRAKMAESMGRALGRPVTIGEIELRLIPQPGFFMTNVEVGDDPAFGNEPILRAERVTAYLRLSSLWRGRLEIARLNLEYPSLNLVQSKDGHWNVESLLWRASRTQVAPTGQKHAETRVRFPYIAAEQGRVNFSFGAYKSVFSFIDADVALFSPQENQWRIRLEAKPVRTDTNISDTGLVKADLGFERAEMLRDTKVHGNIQWDHGQLGMISKLIYGRDRGWRGALELDSEVSGSPAELHFTATSLIQDFRRYDIYAGDTVKVGMTCKGVASVPTYSMQGFQCQLPVAPGVVSVTGSFGPRASSYDISAVAENISANSVVSLVRHIKKNIPQDLTATGSLNAAATFQRSSVGAAVRTWRGQGSTTDITLKSALLKEPLALKPVRFDVRSPEPGSSAPKGKKPAKEEARVLPDEILTFATIPIPFGAKTPATLDAHFAQSGYQVNVAGPAEIEHVIGFARTIGILVPKITLRGDVLMNLSLVGAWQGLPEPAVNGTAKVTNGRAEIPGIAQEIVIAQSDVALSGNEFVMNSLEGEVGGLKFAGWTRLPRHCEADVPCGPMLNLEFEDLDVAKLDTLLNPNLKKRPWYKLFGSSSEESLLSKVYASGRVAAKKAEFGRVAATKLFADFRLNSGELLVSNVNAELLGGSHFGQWHADFRGAAPVYSGSGRVSRLNVAQIGNVLKANVGAGTISSGRYDVKMSGWSGVDLAKSADASATFDWTSPTIRAFALSSKGPGRVSDFYGKLAYKDGVLRFDESRMTTSNGIYSVTGTAEGEKLALELTSSSAGYKVTGTLKAPEVVVSDGERKKSPTEASLKR